MGIAATFRQKLFRWQSDGNMPFELGQRRIFILPSRSGLLYALTLALMLSGAINYNLALGHALVFLLVGLGITGMVHTVRNLHGLHIRGLRCEPVFAGETAYFEIELSNQREMPRCGLLLETGRAPPVRTDVSAEGKAIILVPVASTQRGWLELPRIRLSTTYPLGLFTAWAYLQPAMRCLIYPAALASPLPAKQAASPPGKREHEGGDEDFSGFRERQPADSPRHIAWKASARSNPNETLLVKQFAGSAGHRLHLDWSQTDPALDIETRLAMLTGWVQAAATEGHHYSLTIPGASLMANHGDAHRRQCLEALALCQV